MLSEHWAQHSAQFCCQNRVTPLVAVATGDERTAEDAYRFLLGFLTRFPQFAGRPFWIGGESYGGHYVPNLALQVCHEMHLETCKPTSQLLQSGTKCCYSECLLLSGPHGSGYYYTDLDCHAQQLRAQLCFA